MDGLTIRPLTPAMWAALAVLFREPSQETRWCWCMYWRKRARDFSASTVAQNRAGLESLAGRDPSVGLIAFEGARAVGWVSLGPRSDFERLERSRRLPRVDDLPVWSIVCFVVSPGQRGRGIARHLLDAAIAFAREHGAVALEAYPADAGGTRISASGAYRGTLSMFRAAGFERVAGSTSRTGGVPSVIVRLALRPVEGSDKGSQNPTEGSQNPTEGSQNR